MKADHEMSAAPCPDLSEPRRRHDELTRFLRWLGRRYEHGRDQHAECFYCDVRMYARQYRAEVPR